MYAFLPAIGRTLSTNSAKISVKVYFDIINQAIKIKKIPLQIYSLEGRYATAIFSAASKLGNLVQVEKDLQKIRKKLEKSVEINRFFKDPSENRQKKKIMMEKLFSDTHYEKTVLNMLMILTDNGRLSLTSKVIDTFEKIMEAHNKISLIKVTSATVRLIF